MIESSHATFAKPHINRHNESSFEAAVDGLRSSFVEDSETGAAIEEVAESQTSLTILLEAQLVARRVLYVSSHSK